MRALIAISVVATGTGLPSTGHAASALLIDNGESGYSETGSWTQQAVTNTRVNSNWKYQNSSGGADTATYLFSGLSSGRYVAARSSFTQGNLSSAASYAVSDGGGTYVQDQRVSVLNFDTDGSVAFQRISNFNGYTPVSVTDGTLSITVADTDPTGFLIADAVRIEEVRSDVLKIHVIGNGNSGYAESAGSWYGYGETGDHAGSFRYSGGGVGDQITVSFTGLDSGLYRVSSAWTGGGNGNRSSSVTLAFNTTGASGNMTYSQEPGAEADDVFENVNWQDMFTGVNVTDGTLTLTLTNNVSGGNELMIADGFRLELIPEPSGFALLGVGAAGLFLRRRRA
ncbi:MAG: PEP-CTERM sorting domain-containing protein [Verrucomicrobia bacterium]|nr:PEP-CTERM sorting domain-containing protein [Verrucomicrobiota bacterium]